MNFDFLVNLLQLRNASRIDQAQVIEVFCQNNTNGYIVVSYRTPGANRASSQTLRLNLNPNTIVLDSSGQRLCVCCIQKGMWISAVYSPSMTRSIPPQANAFAILVPQMPQRPSSVTNGRIASIDAANRFLYTGNPNDINTQTRYLITNGTFITDRRGRPIRLQQLRPGQLVRITHANFQTASIPPQTTAFDVQLL